MSYHEVEKPPVAPDFFLPTESREVVSSENQVPEGSVYSPPYLQHVSQLGFLSSTATGHQQDVQGKESNHLQRHTVITCMVCQGLEYVMPL